MLNNLLRLKNRLDNNWFYAFAIAVFTLLVLSTVFVTHSQSFFINQDNVYQFYSWYQKLAISWHHGYLPLWNASTYSGWPFAAEMQPGVLYPLNWLWVALFGSVHGISELALNYLVALHFWIAAFGAFLFIKELGSKRWIAFLTGITFAFSGMIALRSSSQTAIFFALTFICYPVYFLAKYHNDAKQRLRWPILAGLFLGLTLLVGHIGPFFYALIAATIFEAVYIVRGLVSKKSVKDFVFSLKGLVIVGIVALIVALPQLIISLPYLSNSYRVQLIGYMAPHDKISYQIFSHAFIVDLKDFTNFIDPTMYQVLDANNLYIGLVPLLIVLIVAYVYRDKLRQTKLWHKNVSFATTIMLAGFLGMIGYSTWFAVVLYKTPFIYQIREPGRYVVLFSLGLMLVFAAALEVIVHQKLSRKQRLICLAAGGFLLINSLYILLLRKHTFTLHYALQTGVLSVFLLTLAAVTQQNYRKLIISALVLTTASLNILWFLPKQSPDVPKPADYNLPQPLVQLLEQTSGKYRVAVSDWALPVNVGNVYNFQTTNGYSATIYAPYYEFINKNDMSSSAINDFLGVQMAVVKTKPKNGNIIYSDPQTNTYVVERPTALSKIFATKVWQSDKRSDYYSLDSKTLAYNDVHQLYQINMVTASNVILSEIYYKGWVAKVDGRTVTMSDYAVGTHRLFDSLYLPAGQHTIELNYKPFGL